jgi:hypothetical protein
MVPLVGFGAARSMNSALAGLGIAVLFVLSQGIGYKLRDDRQRRRAAREHIAGLSRW